MADRRLGSGADLGTEVEPLTEDPRRLIRTMGRDGLEDLLWPPYGRLVSELQDVLEVVDDVAPTR